MANSGGGLIVYGINEIEDPNSTAAADIQPVGEISEATLQQIRQAAGSLIYPPIVALRLYRLAPDAEPSAGVLALLVPDSPDAPHLVHPPLAHTDYFMAPWRDGPHTSRMVERQLATAYELRGQAARRRTQELDDLWSSALRSAGASSGSEPAWIVAAALPDRPASRPRELTMEQADAIFDAAIRSALPRGAGFGPRELLQSAPTRRGLQRFTRRAERPINELGAVARVRVIAEIHGSGAVPLELGQGASVFSVEHRLPQLWRRRVRPRGPFATMPARAVLPPSRSRPPCAEACDPLRPKRATLVRRP